MEAAGCDQWQLKEEIGVTVLNRTPGVSKNTQLPTLSRVFQSVVKRTRFCSYVRHRWSLFSDHSGGFCYIAYFG